MADLSVEVSGIKLKHPVMNASGVLASSTEGVARLAKAGVSAIVTKTLTREPLRGYKPPIVIPIGCSGLLNAVGLENPGIEYLPELVKTASNYGVPIIASIAGRSVEEYTYLAGKAEEYGVNAIEVNLSCPNVKGYGLHAEIPLREVVESVKSTVSIPVWAKLGYSPDIVRAAGKVLDGGADVLVLINTLPGMVIDVYTMKPVLSNKTGGLSGQPIHPVMVYTVYSVYREYGCEIIGVGGITDWVSAIETILAGARAIQIATAFYLKGFGIVREIISGINQYMEEIGVKKLSELIGKAHD
ncbi:MAG: dihydroorotate dehydrogenase PyrD [Thermoprotei archaeon]